jgi:uncharacterized protein
MADITDNAALSRYELALRGEVAFVQYKRDDGVITLVHTEVPRVFAGQGVGSRLVRGVLEDVRRRGEKVVPICSFVAKFIAHHAEFQDMVV